jgi:serine/threonine protein phosphatase PrpC
MRVAWAVESHPGLRRPHNEDSYGARPDLGLFVVADGMGGHAAGEVASRAAVEAIERFVAETAVDAATAPGPTTSPRAGDADRLRAAFRVANRHLSALVAERAELRGMATTAAAVLIARARATVAHVGDSRLYLFRRGTLECVTRDHSWVEEQVRAGTLSATAARAHPWRHIVTRALTGGDDPEVDVVERALEPGDRLLLCSDGLSSVLSDARLAELIGATGALAELCARLVGEADAAGASDDVTALVIDVDVR